MQQEPSKLFVLLNRKCDLFNCFRKCLIPFLGNLFEDDFATSFCAKLTHFLLEQKCRPQFPSFTNVSRAFSLDDEGNRRVNHQCPF